MPVNREELRRYLTGHRAATARLRVETLKRLRSLSVDDARAEYDSLCSVWEASRASGDQRALDHRAIAERVALRRRLDRRR